jgi:hypothetical protein
MQKHDVINEKSVLNQVYNDQQLHEFRKKRELWQLVMSQKLGLKEIKKLKEKGTELMSMNNYG